MKMMGITVDMQTDNFEAAAEFIEKFGSFVREHAPNMSVSINGTMQQEAAPQTSIEVNESNEVGATQPALNGDSAASHFAAIDQQMTLLPIDTPAYDIATDPGRFAFEEEG